MHTKEVTPLSAMEENTTMTYNPLSPRKSAGKSKWAETGTPNTFICLRQAKKGVDWNQRKLTLWGEKNLPQSSMEGLLITAPWLFSF